jgi:peroxiredoxin
MSLLAIGERAPDFQLPGTPEEPLSLSSLLKRHRFVVIAFFPAAFSSVCTDELNLFQEFLDDLGQLGAGVVAISVDSKYSLRAFAEKNHLTFPLLADFHPKGAAAAEYGAMRDDGATERALFIVGSDHQVRYSYLSEISKAPGLDGVLEALESMQGEGA